MFLTRSEYDRGVNTFSPQGRLFQVEYANESIKLGSTAIGIQTAEGVVLAVEKRIKSSLLIPSSVKKIVQLDKHIGAAWSGLAADARTLIDHARVETQNYWFSYDEKMSTKSCVQSVCDMSLNFGKGTMARPFGVSLLVAGVDDGTGPALYHTEPAGVATKYKAKAIGAGSEGAQTQLEEQYNSSMTLEEAKTLCLEILKQVMEDKINSTNVELAFVKSGEGIYKLCGTEEVEEVIKKLSNEIL